MAEQLPCGRKRLVEADDGAGDHTISHIQFGMFGPAEVARLAEFEVIADKPYEMPEAGQDRGRQPVVRGVLDRRLGVSDKAATCDTCGLRMQDCPGHFGYVKLELPVFHIGYLKPMLAVLQCICKTCSRVLLKPEDRVRFHKSLAHPLTKGDTIRTSATFKRIVDACKKVRDCPHCAARNGNVKKVGFARVVHERTGPKDNSERARSERDVFAASLRMVLQAEKGTFESGQLAGSDLKDALPKAAEDLNPVRVRELLRAIPPGDLALLDMSAVHGRPEALLVDHLLVPPVPIRPSVMADASIGSNEDDLTLKICQIVSVNNIIRGAIEGGKATITMLMEDWDYLQLQVAMYINGANVPGVRADWQAEKKPIRAFAQRLKGKQGRFRGNLSGKRVDFSGRTVISPDPNLGIDEVGVPDRVAKVLTYPERVNAHNLSRMRKLVLNGPNVWPGANYVENEVGKRTLKFGDRRRVSASLKVGDLVERHMCNGDVVLFNRQPSLHKLSIMAHRARVVPHRTFRFNECVCAPYNADFDGDEMNMHLPQTEEARAEALCLMSVHANLVTPRNGEIVVAATQDFITGAYLLSKQGMFFTRDQFARLVAYMADAAEQVDFPPPAILKPVEMWTGKQITTVMLRPSRLCTALVSVEVKNKSYNPNREKNPEPLAMCPADGWVVIHNSEHLCGSLDKALMGGGTKSGLLSVLLRESSALAAAQVMERLSRITSRFLADYGFSIGVADVQPTPRLTEAKRVLLAAGYEACSVKIGDFESGKLTEAPGCTAEQTLESEINGLLSKIRDDAGEICKRELHPLNAPLIMATCGSKGSSINISQMIACVGQQSVGGRRMPNGFIYRALPHFPRHSRDPPDKGFVANSFYTGLSPTEFFFHTMGGREGLVDTAVKTAETGYMQRRLMKALEDLTVGYDGSVRNSETNLIQFRYGDDGLDPAMMEEQGGRPVNFERTLLHTYAQMARSPSERSAPVLTAAEARRQLETFLRSPDFIQEVARAPNDKPTKFEMEVRNFVTNLIADLAGGADIAPDTGGGTAAAKNAKGAAGAGCVKLEPGRAAGVKPGVKPGVKSAVKPAVKFAVKLEVAEAGEAGGGDGAGRATRVGSARRVIQDEDDEERIEAMDDTPTPAATPPPAGTIPGLAPSAPEEDPPPSPHAPPPPNDPAPFGGVNSHSPNGRRLTRATLASLLSACLSKYRAGKVEAGTAVGAIGAQSIGEPGTQMTLKTFTFAGVASMNITLGVPRIKEIINAAKKISTPIVKCELDDPYDLASAKAVKGRMERTGLELICKKITQVYDATECYVSVRLDLALISEHRLEIDAHSVRRAILQTPKMKLTENDVEVFERSEVRVYPPKAARPKQSLFELHRLSYLLKPVLVTGIKGVTRAVIAHKEQSERPDPSDPRPCYRMVVEGEGLQDVLGVRGVRGQLTRSTHIAEVEKTLGIEAARQTIMHEIQDTMGHHGMDIDSRHVTLLADVMSFRGEVLGITRFGVPKMKQSVLMLASFEKTTDHLFEAAVHARADAVLGVSERIILGIPISLGTGIFQMLHTRPPPALPKGPPLLMPHCEKKLLLGSTRR